MVKFAVYARIRPDKQDEFVEALREYLPTVSAERGTVRYDVYRGEGDRTSFLFTETYVDEDAEQAHVQSAAFKSYIERIRPWLAEPPQVLRLFESAKQ
jgi:quinol monooxygenase YgiN